jgi:hypothetical protein
VALRVEQLECRLQPAAWDPLAAVALHSGISVGPLSLVFYAQPINTWSESGSGTDSGNGVDANGLPFTSQTTYAYTFSVTVSGGVRTETYDYSWDTVTAAAGPGGLNNHDWGTFDYVFTWSRSDPTTQFTMTVDLDRQQLGTQTVQASSPDGTSSSMTETEHDQEVYHRYFTNQTDNGNLSAQATDIGNGTATRDTEGSGTYSWSAGTGTVSGTNSAAASDAYSYTFSTSASRDAAGAVTFAGTWDDSTTASQQSSYSGSGTYDASGGDPSYWWTGTGTITESGSDNWNASYDSHWVLAANGTWQASSGSGSGSGSLITDWSESSSGDYTYLVTGGSVTGTWSGANHEHSETDATEDWTLPADGIWVSTGTWDNTTTGGWNTSYDGSGTYEASGGDPSYSWTGTGTITESGSEDWAYNYSSSYDLQPDGTWVVVSGSGQGAGTQTTDWTDSSNGDYTYVVPGGSVMGTWQEVSTEHSDASSTEDWTLTPANTWVTTGTWDQTNKGGWDSSYAGSGTYDASGGSPSYSWTGTGTITESGDMKWKYNSQSSYSLQPDGTWAVVSGTGVASSSETLDSTNDASGNYTYLVPGGSVTGTWSQGSDDHSHSSSSEIWTLAANNVWVKTGTVDNTDNGGWYSSYSGSGTYNANGSDGQTTWVGTGTITEAGNEVWAYSEDSSYALQADGTWVVVGGTGHGDGSKTSNWSDDSSGTYTAVVSGVNVSGTWATNVNQQWDTTTTEDWTLQPDDTWVTTGTYDNTTSGGWDTSYNGSGTYTINGGDPSYSWTGTGTFTESGSDNWTYSYSSSYNLLADGTWVVAGGSGQGQGTTIGDWSDNSSGTYTYPVDGGAVTGTWNESASEHSQTDTTENWTLTPANVWVTTGTSDNTTTGGWNSSYSGNGTYVVMAGDPSNWVTGTGTIAESGSDTWNYSYSSSYNLQADGTWAVAGGSGTGQGTATTDWSDQASGTYGYTVTGGQVMGTWDESSNQHSQTDTTAAWTLTPANTWVTTGTADNTTTGGWKSSYDGSGTYLINGGDPSYWWAGTGTITESGNVNWTYSYGSSYDLLANGTWVVVSGSGSASGGATTDWTDNASGTYGYTVPGGQVTGTWDDSSNEHSVTTESKTFTLTPANVWLTTATWDNTTSGGSKSSYSGNGTYDASGGDPSYWWTGTGTISESGNSDWTYSYSSSYDLLANGTWVVVGGSGTGSGGGTDSWTDDASGSYGYLVAGGQVTGTWSDNSNETAQYTETLNWTLGADGNWTTTGTWSGSDQGGSQSSYSGNGTYTINFGGLPGSWTTGTGTITESGNKDFSFSANWSYNLGPNGQWVVVSGSGTATGSGATNWSYNASGSYGHPLDGGTLTGTWNASGHNTTTSSQDFTLTLNNNNVWIQTGTQSSTQDVEDKWSYSGAGSYSTSTSNSGSSGGTTWSSDSTFNSTDSEYGTHDQTMTQAITAVFAADGSVTTTTNLAHTSSDTSGYSYSANGTSDSSTDFTGPNSTSHTESHDVWSRDESQTWASSSQDSVTTVSGPGGTTITGGGSGTSHGTGDRDYQDSASGSSSSSSWGSDPGTQSGAGSADGGAGTIGGSGGSGGGGGSWSSSSSSSWYSNTSSDDHYVYQADWSWSYNPDGSISSTSSSTDHVWGSAQSSWGNSWSWSSTGPGGNAGDSGGSSGSSSSSYDNTFNNTPFVAWPRVDNGGGPALGKPAGPMFAGGGNWFFVGGGDDKPADEKPGDKTVTEVPHIYKYDKARGVGTDPVFKLQPQIDGNNLTIKVEEGKAFKKEATDKRFPWGAVLSGLHTGDNAHYKDTDSMQVAVRWGNADKKDLGHATNAQSADKARAKGAEWKFGGKPGAQTAEWSTKIPDEATRVDIIIIYTDTLFNTPGNGGGDLPIIIGSYTLERKDAKTPWTIKSNPDDLFKPQKTAPDPKDYDKIIKDTQDKLKEKTGYELRARPEGLSPKKTRAANKKIIDAAVTAGTINGPLDTGFDIVPRK